MAWQKKVGQETLFFIFTLSVSALFWFAIALGIDQYIIAPEYLYLKERNACGLTILFIYFVRFNAYMSIKRNARSDMKNRIISHETPMGKQTNMRMLENVENGDQSTAAGTSGWKQEKHMGQTTGNPTISL